MRALLVALLATGCLPSRAALFDPVSASVRERTGLDVEWRSSWRRSAGAERRVKELLGRPLGAEEIALVALLSNSRLQAAYAELAVAGGELSESRTPRNPELEGEIVFPSDGDAHIELSAVQDVTHLLRLIPGVGGGEARLRAARREAVAATVDLAARARIAYYRAAAAEQRVRFRLAVAEAATAAAILARSLRASGGITELQLTRELLFEEDAHLAVRDAEAELALAREEVNAVCGLFGDETRWTLSDDPLPEVPDEAPDVANLEREAVAASLELDARRWRIDGAGRDVGLARLESFVPELGAGVSAKREGDGWAFGPAVTLSIPLWDWGSGRRGAAQAHLTAEQHRYTAQAIELRARARAAATLLTRSQQRVARMRSRVLPLRERLADESIKQFNAMNLDAFELLTLRREAIEVEERYLEAVRDYWIAAAEVAQLRAGSLPGGETP